MIVEQAIFGIKSGRGHGLISSTIDRKLLEGIRTDFLATINAHSNWQPYYKTQVLSDYFLFLKTFPDNDQDRKGSVFTHVLMLKKSEIHLLENLNDIFSLFKNKDEHSTPLKSINLHPTVFKKSQNSSVNKVVHYLVHPKKANKPIIWIDREAFLQMISELWSLLPQYTRQSFTFTYSIKPEDLTEDKYYVIYSSQINYWDEYNIVKKEDTHQPTTTAELFILNPKTGNDLSLFLTELDLKIYDFSKLQSIQKAAESYQSLDSLNFQKTLELLKRLTDLIPNVKKGAAIKEKILSRVLKLMPKTDIDEVLGLGNLKINSMPNAQTRIENAIGTHLKKELVKSNNFSGLIELLTTFFQYYQEGHWWYKLINTTLKSFFNQNVEQSSELTWRIWGNNIQFINWLNPYIPNTQFTEKSFAKKTPLSLSKELGESIRFFSIKRNWFLLHGHIATTYLKTMEAFKLQLAIDTNPRYFDGLNVIAERVNSNEIIDAALKLKDKRLLFLAGKACNQQQSLFNNIELDNTRWQEIWLEKIKINPSSNIWNGFKNPDKSIFKILDLIIKEQAVNSELLLQISQSNYNNILNYSRRKDIWKILPSIIKTNFLKATAKAWYKKLSIQIIHEELEIELLQEVSKIDSIKAFIFSTSSFSLVLELFKRFGHLTEPLFCKIITQRLGYSKILEPTEAIVFGKLVLKKDWKEAQKIIIKNFSRYNNLGFAIKEFEPNIGFWGRGRLISKGYSNKCLSVDDWWRQFTNVMTKLYPNGIMDNRIWERSGGEIEGFSQKDNSKEQWWDALKKLRNGSGGEKISAKNLLQEIESENPKNEYVQILINTYKQLK